MQNDLYINNFYVHRFAFIPRRGLLQINSGKVTFYGFAKTLLIGEVATLRYHIDEKSITFYTPENKRYRFVYLHQTWQSITQPEVKALFAKTEARTETTFEVTSKLIEEKLNAYEMGQYLDKKYTHNMWEVILDALGAQKI